MSPVLLKSYFVDFAPSRGFDTGDGSEGRCLNVAHSTSAQGRVEDCAAALRLKIEVRFGGAVDTFFDGRFDISAPAVPLRALEPVD
jgi:hypothetical protein